MTAWFTRLSASEARLWWPYDEKLLEEFKALVPSSFRKWHKDVDGMWWTVTGQRYVSQVDEWFRRHFPVGFSQSSWDDDLNGRTRYGSSRTSSPPPSPPPPSSNGSDWDTLYLQRGAPAGLVDVAYRWWIRETHPDLGGSTQRAQEINAAYGRLRKVAR